jgi:hypothetical protein
MFNPPEELHTHFDAALGKVKAGVDNVCRLLKAAWNMPLKMPLNPWLLS